jgi:hypothetical protein
MFWIKMLNLGSTFFVIIAKIFILQFNNNMNLIQSQIYQHNINNFTNWVDSTPVNKIIDTMTYDLYESNNPFRKTFDSNDINNKGLRVLANTTNAVGAEVFSAFTNPYYLSHKITQIPVWCDSVVETYKKYST